MDYRYRFLSSAIGRFVQPDPIIPDLTNSQSLNRYSYTNNNPINFVDPSGHVPEGACGFGGGDCGIVGDILTDPDQGEDEPTDPISEDLGDNHEDLNHNFEFTGEFSVGSYDVQFSPELFNPLFYLDVIKFCVTGTVLSALGITFVAIGVYSCTLGPAVCAAGVVSAAPAAAASFVASGLVFYGGFKYIENHFSHSIKITKKENP